MRESREKRLLAATGMVKAFHREQFPLDGVMGLVEQGAGHRHLRVFKHRIPARLLVLKPAPHPLAVGRPRRGGRRGRQSGVTVGQAQTPASPCAGVPGIAGYGTGSASALRTGDAIAASFFGSLRSAWRRQLPTRTPGNSVRILLVVLSKPSVSIPGPDTRAPAGMPRVETPIGLGKGCGTGLLSVAQMPDTRPRTIVGRYTLSVRQWLCFSSARK